MDPNSGHGFKCYEYDPEHDSILDGKHREEHNATCDLKESGYLL